MKILYWDIENIKYLIDQHYSRDMYFDLIQCSFAKPFDDIQDRIVFQCGELKQHHLQSRGPDLADYHLLALLNFDAIEHGRDNDFFLASHDKLLSYRFIVLCRNLGIHRHNIHTLLPDIDIRRRSKKGRGLFEDGDLDKIPLDIQKSILDD